MPFVNDIESEFEELIINHINDSTVHIQPGERNFWSNKLNYSLDK